MENLKELLELNDLIKIHLSQIKKSNDKKIINEYNENVIFLKNCWKKESGFEYPMVPNKKGKPVDIKTLIKEMGLNKNIEYKPPSLDSIINRTTNDYNLVNSLYDKTYNTDIPDPYRKRKK